MNDEASRPYRADPLEAGRNRTVYDVAGASGPPSLAASRAASHCVVARADPPTPAAREAVPLRVPAVYGALSSRRVLTMEVPSMGDSRSLTMQLLVRVVYSCCHPRAADGFLR